MYVLIFLAAIVAANLSISYFGPISSPVNAFLLIGLDLTLRDKLHDAWRGKNLGLKMLGLIFAGGIVTWGLNRNAGMICVASIAAFSAALLVDAVIYELLAEKRKIIQINGSNICAAATDSVIFPTLAFGVFMPEIILLQFLAKSCGGLLWSILLRR